MKKFLFVAVALPIVSFQTYGDSSSGTLPSPVLVAPVVDTATVLTSSAAVSVSSRTASGERVIHAIHLTSSAAGSKRYRANKLNMMLASTIINTVVVDIKEEEGQVYVPGVKAAEHAGAYERAIPDLQSWLADLKRRGIYTIARIVVFKDNRAPRKNKSWGVHNASGELWYDRHKITWLDPYNQEAWRYDLVIAFQAAKSGFDEIQFDYIRFPTDGKLSLMRFSRPYNRETAAQALVQFLHQAAQLLHPLGVKLSIDVFGLTTSVNTGMGIGQRMGPMTEQVDFVCPMTYPSHYARGEYGIPNPNDQPYRTIHLAMHDALKVLGPEGAHKLRPYLQDFSLKGRGIKYHAKEVRAQMQAAADMGVGNWTLWNASCHYTLDALREEVMPRSLPKATTEHASAPLAR